MADGTCTEVSILSNDLQRLGSFAAYPRTCPQYFTRLSSAGFSYTGKNDVVTCSDCHVKIGDWNEKDIPLFVHQQRSPTCPVVLNLLGKDVYQPKNAKLQDRKETPEIMKHAYSEQSHNATSEINLFASETLQQPYDSTDGSSSLSSINVDGFKRENSVESGVVSHPSESGSFLLQSPSMIPYKKPRYPKHSILCERLQTFNKWPRRYKQSPENLSRAGFFYTGVDDLVRCFHCGGGLTHWESEDNPWVEHAHWFPKCVFLRQNKGDEFIAIVQSMVEQQKQEQGRQQANTSDQLTRKPENNIHTNSATWNVSSGATGYTHDMQTPKQARQMDDKVNTADIKDLIAVKSVQEMGYDLNVIIPAYHRAVTKHKTNKISAVQIMEKVFEMEEQQQDVKDITTNHERIPESVVRDATTHHERIPESVAISATPDSNNEESIKPTSESNTPDNKISAAQSATDANNQSCIQFETATGECKGPNDAKYTDTDLLLCKVCMEEQVCIVFLPCGHLATCGQCAPAMKKCPICRQHVKGSVKTYLS